MSEDAPKKAHPNARRLVILLWLLVAGWLLISIAGSVANAIFFGDGPFTPAPAAVEAEPTPTPPATPPR